MSRSISGSESGKCLELSSGLVKVCVLVCVLIRVHISQDPNPDSGIGPNLGLGLGFDSDLVPSMGQVHLSQYGSVPGRGWVWVSQK